MLDRLLIKHGFGKCLSATPTKCLWKMEWLDVHTNHAHKLAYSHFDTIIIGDSIAAGLSRYSNVWETFFKESLNLGIGSDCIQHILWQVEHLPVPSHLKYFINHCCNNNISKDTLNEIANSILCIALIFKKETLTQNIYYQDFSDGWQVFVTRFRITVPQNNQLLNIFPFTYDFIDFLEPMLFKSNAVLDCSLTPFKIWK